VKGCRQREIVPHVARKEKIKTPDLDGRTIGSTAYRVSQIIRKRVEEIIGWIKVIGGLRRSRYQGTECTQACGYFVAATYYLLCMARLELAGAG
jgi:hypothetical protein